MTHIQHSPDSVMHLIEGCSSYETFHNGLDQILAAEMDLAEEERDIRAMFLKRIQGHLASPHHGSNAEIAVATLRDLLIEADQTADDQISPASLTSLRRDVSVLIGELQSKPSMNGS